MTKSADLGDSVIVRVLEGAHEPPGNRATAEKDLRRGEVVAIGDRAAEELRDRDRVLTTGDEVLYRKYGGEEVTIDGIDLLVLRESDILGTPRFETRKEAIESAEGGASRETVSALKGEIEAGIAELRALAK